MRSNFGVGSCGRRAKDLPGPCAVHALALQETQDGVAEPVVAEQARRSGVARALIRAAAGTADSAGIGWMRTWPSPNGPDAEQAGRIALFTACGMDPWRPSANLLQMVARTKSVLDATLLARDAAASDPRGPWMADHDFFLWLPPRRSRPRRPGRG